MPKKSETSINILKMSRSEVADVYGVQPRAITEWAGKGCPRNSDKTYNLKKVIKWNRENVKVFNSNTSTGNEKQDAEIKKLQLQAEKLEHELQEKRRNTMPFEEVVEMQQKQSDALMDFLQNGYKRNAQIIMRELGLAGSDLKKFLDVMDGFVKSAMDKFVESGVDLDR